MIVLILSITAFLIGSVPTGMLVAKQHNIDLKKVGSGNIGATNVLRSIGKGAALLTLVGDIAKGMVPVLFARYFEVGILAEGIIGICSILGHNFSIFLKFKGGKGVATSMGMLSIYSPPTAIVTIIIWIMVALISRYSSLGALISFGLLPLSILVLDSKEKLPISFFISLLLIVRHRDNILNLVRGTERRIGKKT